MVYTTKIIDPVCRPMCVMACYAFRSARHGAETWHGGRGRAPEAQEHIFEATPSKVRGHPDFNLPLEWPMATKCGLKDP